MISRIWQRSDLAVKVRDGLTEAGIELALPQRELHLRGAAPMAVDRPGRRPDVAPPSPGAGNASSPAAAAAGN